MLVALQTSARAPWMIVQTLTTAIINNALTNFIRANERNPVKFLQLSRSAAYFHGGGITIHNSLGRGFNSPHQVPILNDSDLLAYLYHLVHTIISEMSRAEKQQRMDRFFSAHRQGGLPVTTQRRAVFEAIQHRTDHPTAEQLYRAVRAQLPQVSRMTVHRILGTFVSLGLIARTCHPGSAARFDPKVDQHHHLVCMG